MFVLSARLLQVHYNYFSGQFVQEPVTVELGTSYQYKKKGAKRVLVEKPDTFQYVPLIDNLQWILQNTDVYQEVSLSTTLKARRNTNVTTSL